MRFRLKPADSLIEQAPASHQQAMESLLQVVQKLSAARSCFYVSALVCRSACSLTGCLRAVFLLWQRDSHHCSTNRSVPLLCRKSCHTIDKLAGKLIQETGKPLLITDLNHDSRVPQALADNSFFSSLAMLPISSANPIGAVGCYWVQPHSPTTEQLQILQVLSDTASIAIANIHYRHSLAQKNQELEEAMNGTLLIIARMVEQKDPYTSGHQRRVSQLAYDIARQLGWEESRCQTLRRAALVHDIGKIGIPSDLLTKPTALTLLEKKLIETHAQAGYDILKDLPFFNPLAQIIYQHHERMDGSGYPLGLTEKMILPEARLLAVADVFEAMTSHRPYRPALSTKTAFQELQQNPAYDAGMVQALVSLIQQKGYQVPEQ